MQKRGLILGALLLLFVAATPEFDDCQLHAGFSWFSADPEYDAVLICGICYPCSEISDGVCPEDFANNEKRASCINKPDADCVARLRGTVRSLIDGQEQVDSIITAFPPPGSDYNPIKAYTDGNGDYIIENISAGRWTLRAEKLLFDTEIKEEILIYGKTNIVDFNLPATSCNADCTDSFGRCSPQCDGIRECNFVSTQVKVLCEDLEPGTEVIVNQTGEFVNKIRCCTGEAEVQPEFRPRAVVHGNMDNLVQREIVARMNNDIVKVKVAIWQ